MKFFPILIAIAFIAGCSWQSVPTPSPTHKADSAIIVIPGYYGSRLVREDGELIFISLAQGLFGDQPLTLPIPDLGLKGTTNLTPAGILDEVSIIPLAYSIDVYGSLLEQLSLTQNQSREVIPFSYDWREDLIAAVRSLDTLIRKTQAEGKKDISLVAHSMGGLIASYYLRYGTQNVDSAIENWQGAKTLKNVVLIGVPFHGVIHSLRNMNAGVTVGLNSSLLSSEAYASFPSSYYTLPIADSDELLTPDRQSLKGRIRNPDQWRTSEWGLLHENEGRPKKIQEKRAAYTSFWLQQSERFLELLQAPQATTLPTPPSLLYVYGKSTPTLNKGVWMGNQTKGQDSVIFSDSALGEPISTENTSTIYADGDGTVTVTSAILPAAYRQNFPTTIQEYEVEHTDLVSCPEIQQNIATFLERY